MPPPKVNIGGDGHLSNISPDDRLKVKAQMKSGVSPSTLVINPTIASAELEGQQSSGFHPSVLAS